MNTIFQISCHNPGSRCYLPLEALVYPRFRAERGFLPPLVWAEEDALPINRRRP